ncbi:MAG TPA: nuclear transport factor 2 family protein [Solirubrobacterales bacterium]|nr:nuclear transport factor 2 family protein [Solirubrobacterales bacterium]
MAAPNVEELERQFNAAMEEADTGSSLEAIRRVYGELESEDSDAIAAIVHPKFELQVETSFLSGKSYKGVRGYLNWRREMGELFEQERFQPVGIRFAGRDRWVVLGRMHLKEADGGAELDLPLAHACEQRDRKVARIAIYSDISAALESIGLYV